MYLLLFVMFNYETLIAYETAKKIKSNKHPSRDLIIWNYTELCQFKHMWDEITLQCRSIITDSCGQIVARSFPKFFNSEESQKVMDQVKERVHMPFRVFEKVDGSIGLLFWHIDSWVFSSRASFTSDQAVKAMMILQQQHPNFEHDLSKTETHIFEIIYPENRIVVNYGNAEKLVYLSSFALDGTEHLRADIMNEKGYHVAKELLHEDNNLCHLRKKNIANEEGYVVRFDDGFRVKVKFENYLILHRTASNMTPKTVLEWLISGKTKEEMAEIVPDEFMDWMNKTFDELVEQNQFIRCICLMFMMKCCLAEELRLLYKTPQTRYDEVYNTIRKHETLIDELEDKLANMYDLSNVSDQEEQCVMYFKEKRGNLCPQRKEFFLSIQGHMYKQALAYLYGQISNGATIDEFLTQLTKQIYERYVNVAITKRFMMNGL